MKATATIRHSLTCLLASTTTAVCGWAEVLEDFSSLSTSNAFYAGSWEASDSLSGSASPQGSFLQGDGSFAIDGSGVTNDGSSFLEVHFDTPRDLSSADSLYVTAQALSGNTATSFEVRLFDTAGASAFATFAASSFPTGGFSTSQQSLVTDGEFNAESIEILRVSGARLGGTQQLNVSLDEIATIPPVSLSFHDSDTDQDGTISLSELLRIIELYNTRFGTTRTGAYALDAGSSDGFAPDSTRSDSEPVTLARYHSADTDDDGKISLSELLRLIELYNYREGTTRTGAYRVDASTDDGFAPGPRD